MKKTSFQSLNEEKRIIGREDKKLVIEKRNPNLVDNYKNQFINNLNSEDKEKIKYSLWDLAKCFQIDPSTSLFIEKKHIIKIIEMMESNDIYFISLAFNFLTIFIQCNPDKIPFFADKNVLEKAISKIPIQSAVDFIIELLKFSDNLNENDPLSVYPFFLENDLRSKLLNLFSQLQNISKYQAQILRILSFIWKNKDFSKDELNIFINASNDFFLGAENDHFIIYLNFLISIKSRALVLTLVNRDPEFKLLETIWQKINDKNDNVCLACFDFLIDFINFDPQSAFNYFALISSNVSHNMTIFQEIPGNPNNVRLRGAKFIELLINDRDFCFFFINKVGAEYINLMKEFLKTGCYYDQYLAMRFVSVLMKYNQAENICQLLLTFDPIEKIIDFLNGEDYSFIIKLLNAIQNTWDVFFNLSAHDEFHANMINLMENSDFIFALQYIETSENKDASLLAKQLINYMKKLNKC